jgi:hypothetical protein
MNLIALGFWISVGLAILEAFHVISIGWLLVLAPFLLGIGISIGIIFLAFVIGLIALMLAGK